MRHKLLYLLALALATTGVGWGQKAIPEQTVQPVLSQLRGSTGDPKIERNGTSLCFANGRPIRIYQKEGSSVMVVEDTQSSDTLEFAKLVAVYGGGLQKAVASTSITLESGTVTEIYGGGYSKNSSSSANVTGNASIYIKGGKITNMLVGGGVHYSKARSIDILIQDGEIESVIAGGYDEGKTSNRVNTPLAESVNGADSVRINMFGGTAHALGCGGGQGYSITGVSEVYISNVTLGGFYGTLFNGRAEKITAAVLRTTFESMEGAYKELAAINRGAIGTASFLFEACSFNDLDWNYSLAAVQGWADSDTNGKPVPEVSGKVSFTFTNSPTETPVMIVGQGLWNADVELAGACAKIADFRNGANVSENLKTYTLAEGKTWTFNDGLMIDPDVVFTKNGSLNSALTAEKQANGKYDVYANGTPIEITSYSSDSVKITKQGQTNVIFKGPSSSSVFGGAKEAEVASTSVILTSGKVFNLFGGGRSEKAEIKANVTGTASIKVAKGAIVSNMLVGGGYWYSKAKAIVINLQGATVNGLLPGGFDQGKTSNRLDTDLAQSVNGAETVDITVDQNSKVSTFGCGGGQGYSLTGTSTIKVGTAEIGSLYGTLTNGRADNITATFTGTTFASRGEIATINRGKVGSGSFKFEGCTINSTGMYLGAAIDWAGSDTNGTPLPAVTNRISYTFTNTTWSTSKANDLIALSRGLETTDIEVTGAKVLMAYFKDGSAINNQTSDFTLAEGKTWTFNGGLKREGDKYTFTKQGTLNATALDASDLLTLASVHADKIALVEGTYELPSQLTITKPMVLNGAGMDKTVIKAGAADWAHTYNADLNMIAIENATNITPAEGGEVVISNLTLSNSKRSGLNAQSSMAVKLDSVTLKDNPAAGLVVHSKVDATDIHTSGNIWGGVNIDKGTPEYSTLCFTFEANSTFAEKAPIYSELYDKEGIVVVPDDSWERLVQMSDESKGVAMWLKRLIVAENEDRTATEAFAGRNVLIRKGGILRVTAPLALNKVTMEEGARLVPTAAEANKVTAATLQLNASLKDSEWKAFGFPSAYKVQSATEPATEYTTPTADPEAATGAWFATLKGSTTPEFEYKTDAFGQAGLLAATNGDYQIISTNEPSAPIELKAATEPEAPTTATFTIFANTGTDELTLTKNKYIYKLDAAENEFVQCTDAVKILKPFESVILTDETTYSTLRSLRLGNGIVTGTQAIEPTEGYYVTTERGAIVIHTAEATRMLIVEMSGRIAYKGMATDGQRILVPTGIYAVNGQLVRVK